jgi:hypothetical protein
MANAIASAIAAANGDGLTSVTVFLNREPPMTAGEELAVQYMLELYPATVSVVGSTPIFDPENARIRS